MELSYMQSIIIATSNTQKKSLPQHLIISLASKTLLKSNYIKSYTSILKTWKDYTNISHIVQYVKCL